MSLSADVFRIREIFTQSADLRVPPYQRGFAWTDKEISALLHDLVTAFDDGNFYFLGAMVAIQPKPRGPSDIVDGQQRISMLTIILSVLRDLSQLADEQANIHQMIGHEVAYSFSNRFRWRVSLNAQDDLFFRKYVQTRFATRNPDLADEAAKESRSESQARLVSAVRAVRDKFSEFTPEGRSRFTRWLSDEVSIVKVRVTETDVGHRVFLVLNQRGRPLADHDMVKSALFERGSFTAQEVNDHSRRWNAFADHLGASDFEGMLRQVRLLYDSGGRGDFITGLVHAVLNQMTVAEFINGMLPRFVDIYDVIANDRVASVDPGPQARRSLAFLRMMQHDGWRAPAIKFLLDRPYDREGAARFFAGLERLAFHLQHCVKDRDYRPRRYKRLLDAMGHPDWMDGPSPLDLSRDEKNEILERLRGRFTNKGRRPVILRIAAAAAGIGVIIPDDDATVEHILPRTPSKGSDWYEEWSRARDLEDLTECIGNFTLLTHAENQEADRKTFTEKLDIYFRNGAPSFALTEDLRGRTRWTPDDVRERRDRLITTLAAEWELDA